MLNQTQLEAFRRDGFLVVEGVLDDDDLRPLELEYEALLDEIANRLYAQGSIDSAYAGQDFAARFARVVAQYPDCIDRMNISLPLVNGEVDAERYRAHTGPAVFGLLRNPKVLDVVEAVIGPEIASSPVQQIPKDYSEAASVFGDRKRVGVD